MPKRRHRPAKSAAQEAPPIVPPAPVERSRAGHWIGLTSLALIVGFVAVWMYLHSEQPAAATRTVPTLPSAPDPAMFRADAWCLPADEFLGFVEIPAGAFLMGSDPSIDTQAYTNERWSAERYRGTVEVPTFYIARYEVTVAQYRAFASATNRDIEFDATGSPDRPIANVSWTDAVAYARWLQENLRAWSDTPPELRRLLNEGWRVGIPSEAEWEKAARGTDGRIFPWGMTATRERANFRSAATVPVGSIRCAECVHGLADMSGNVWELTRSPFQPYPYDASDRPADSQADALYVMRGGSFTDEEANIRTAVRGGIDPGARRPFIGFRLVVSKF
jgi:formylglycine-generating enzyme required for sulfatase activity